MKRETFVKVCVVSTIIAILLFNILIFVVAFRNMVAFPRFHYRNFSDIHHFNALNSYILEGELSDSKIKTLTPEASYVHYVKYDEKEFQIFAYTFSNLEETISYFNNCTGKSPILESSFRLSSYGFHSSFITYYDCCVYRVEGGSPQSVAEFVEFFSSFFDLPLETAGEKTKIDSTEDEIYASIEYEFELFEEADR